MAQAFKTLSRGEIPKAPAMSLDARDSQSFKEFSRTGQVRYDQVKKVLAPGVSLASRRQLNKYTKASYLKKETFLNGRWTKLSSAVPPTVEERLEVENYDSTKSQTLHAYATTSYDGFGNCAQIQGRSMTIDTTKYIQGNNIYF